MLRLVTILLSVFCVFLVKCEDDLPDFDFVDSPIEPVAEESGRIDYYFYGNGKDYDGFEHYFIDDQFNVHINRSLDDTSFLEDENNSFKEKEQRLKKVLLKALSVGELRRKFSEVMPMLRAMSKSQRVTLAALITAQVNARNGNTLSLEQVKQMFGDRPELILPLVLDIANLIRTAAQKQTAEYYPNDRYREQERIPNAQWLRRSFNVNAKGFQKPPERSAKAVPNPKNSFAMHMQDSRLSVEDNDEPIEKPVEDVKENSEKPQPRSMDFEQSDEKTPEALPYIQTSAKKQRYEAMTYHERKMNMTAFNQTEKHKDQLAMASDGPIPVTLPRSEGVDRISLKNLTREQIEDLAFGHLNGTFKEDEEDFLNGTGSGSPTAEMLISRFRKKRPFRKGPISDETCERFTGGVCLKVDDYPMDQIMGSIRRHFYAMEALLAEYRDKEAEFENIDYLGDPDYETNKKRRQDIPNVDSSSAPGSMCNSIIRYARPQKARSATGEWKYIVNTGQHTQTLRLEKCSTPQESCQYLSDNFRSRCIQIYNYHRLLSWDSSRGLHVDIFKVPTCCSCHIDGYREAFPPLALHTSNSIAPNHKEYIDEFTSASSNRNSQYSTLNGADFSEEDFEEDNIAYQYGNGFQRIKHPKDNPALSSNTKIRFDRPPSTGPKSPFPIPIFTKPLLDTFLSPPANDYEANFPFKLKPPNSRNRRPIPTASRKSVNVDEIPPGGEIKFAQATMMPPQLGPKVTERLRNKIIPPVTPTIDTNTVNLRLSNSKISNGKRINYNYHPIIDFFEDDEPPKNGIDRKSARSDNDWKPLVQNHDLDDPRLRGH